MRQLCVNNIFKMERQHKSKNSLWIPFYTTERTFFLPSNKIDAMWVGEKCTWGSCVNWPHFENGPERLQGRHRCSFHCSPFLVSYQMTTDEMRGAKAKSDVCLETIHTRIKDCRWKKINRKAKHSYISEYQPTSPSPSQSMSKHCFWICEKETIL